MIRFLLISIVLLTSISSSAFYFYMYRGAVYSHYDDFLSVPDYIKKHKIKEVEVYRGSASDSTLFLKYKYNKQGWEIYSCNYKNYHTERWYEYHNSYFKQVKNSWWAMDDYDKEQQEDNEPLLFEDEKIFRNENGLIDSVTFVKERDQEKRNWVFRIEYNGQGLPIHYELIVYLPNQVYKQEDYWNEYNEQWQITKVYRSKGEKPDYEEYVYDNKNRLTKVICHANFTDYVDSLNITYKGDTTYMDISSMYTESFMNSYKYVMDENGLISYRCGYLETPYFFKYKFY